MRRARDEGAFVPFAVATCQLADVEHRLGRWDDSLSTPS